MSALPSRAQSVPRIDIKATCNAVEAASSGLADPEAVAGCVRDETAAREQARRRWSRYPAASRRECAAEVRIGGAPSYVDLVTCLELAANALSSTPGTE
ncbi:hypothetical protein [Methylobacterium oryzihabitans]|uniref:Uncharacterized protein n=1 Tax=Methylobacterium oryzihabitans TaxID=2499852 RepID=A0A3S2VC83_9HYPH|nr:hypothetical protein [Methylobacterium oryzihabitans]RVU19381.1 hypothetical protein EOE48_08255 [Methylobacterium oryzihabitans]